MAKRCRTLDLSSVTLGSNSASLATSFSVTRPSSSPRSCLAGLVSVYIVGFHMTSQKFKTKKLSIRPRFYFHDALEELKTNFHINVRFKRVLGFVIEYA